MGAELMLQPLWKETERRRDRKASMDVMNSVVCTGASDMMELERVTTSAYSVVQSPFDNSLSTVWRSDPRPPPSLSARPQLPSRQPTSGRAR